MVAPDTVTFAKVTVPDGAPEAVSMGPVTLLPVGTAALHEVLPGALVVPLGHARQTVPFEA